MTCLAPTKLPTTKGRLTDEQRQIVEDNLGLATNWVAKFVRQSPVFHRHRDDLIAVAAIGLARAVIAHKPEMGALSTIAHQYMRSEVVGWLQDHKTLVRVPRYLQEKAKHYEPGGRLERWAEPYAHGRRIAKARCVEPTDWRLGERHSTSPVNLVDRDDDIAWLKRNLARLTNLERTIVERRACGMTCAEVGKELGIDRSRIGQIESQALDRLREMAAKAT